MKDGKHQHHQGEQCDNPDCPIHGPDGLLAKGFKVFSGKGAHSLGEAIASVLGKEVERAEQRAEIRKQLPTTLKAVLRLPSLQFEDASDDTKAQALMEALCELLAATVAHYSLDFVEKVHGISGGKTYEQAKKTVAEHVQQMLEGTCKHASSSMIMSVAIERRCVEDKAECERARQQAERN